MDILSRKQYRDYDRVSRYSVFPYYYNRLDGKYIYGTTSHLKTDEVTFVSHIVKDGDTYDSLALYYYNNPTYYWVITDFNRVQDPFNRPKVGTNLKIPTFSHIEFNLNI